MSISWDEALDRVGHVVAACVEGDVERLRVEEEAFSVEVRRTPRRLVSLAEQAAGSPAEDAEEPRSEGDEGEARRETAVLKADFVGIVRFSRPVPAEGSAVNEDRELAYVESLGTRNPVRAAGRGAIVAVHVVDGQPVDYGHPLFSVAYE